METDSSKIARSTCYEFSPLHWPACNSECDKDIIIFSGIFYVIYIANLTQIKN